MVNNCIVFITSTTVNDKICVFNSPSWIFKFSRHVMCWCYITLLLHSHDTQKLGLKKEAEFLKLYHLTSYLCDSYMACRKQAK